MYDILKHTHLLCIFLSLTGFILRASWAFQGSTLLQKRITRILPHIIDTFLLLSAIALTIIIHQYPFVHSWLTAKVLGLIVYIVLATFTLKKAKNNKQRTIYFILSLLSFAYIVSVARTHNAFFFL